ncbi:hypothetical protein ACQ4M3_00865 [Leptolyngbya sp. AN03gr2]|uniref:hypothetical protein n=1 Tax=unclassified Leptolyngbya TaxID=2650499 RepID=UPI003D312557
MSDRVKQEALKILKLLSSLEFENCYLLTKDFKELPRQPGLYAIRQRDTVVYLGKALNLRDRFKTGHTALVSAFIDGATAEDLRIAVVTVSPYWLASLEELETRMILHIKPRYNSRVSSIKAEAIMLSTDKVKILDSLPPAIREALEDYGAETGLNPDQVVELAIVNFLDVDAATFPKSFKSIGQLKEENAILKLKLRAAGIEVDEDK